MSTALLSYMDRLCWAQGENDTTVNHSALRAATLGVDSEFAFDEICRRVEASGGELRRGKVRHQIEDAYRHAGTEAPGANSATLAAYRPKPKWPQRDNGLIVRVAGQYGGCADLWEASPVRLDGSEHTEEVVDALFPENPWLCGR